MRTVWNRSVKLFDNRLLRVEEGPEVSGDRLREKPDNPRGEMLLGLPQEVCRTADAPSSPVKDMGVDHRRADVLVSEEFLYRPDIIPVLQQVGSERMPECMASDGLPDPGPLACILDGPLDDGVVKVVPEEAAGRWFRELAVCRKYPLPPP